MDTGRRIEVEGISAGDVTLTAYIDGYLGPPPLVRARVMPRTTVPVYAWIVCGTNGVPAVEETVLRGKFPEINRIWDQAGITWQLAEVNFVTNQEWLAVTSSSGPDNTHDEICLHGCAPTGIELHCVSRILDSNGLTSRRGAVLVGNAIPTTYAHEFGHACGLADIYDSVATTNLQVEGTVGKDRLHGNWSSDCDEGYYSSGLMQSNPIRRLPMFGVSSPNKADVCSHDLFGMLKTKVLDSSIPTWVECFTLDDVPVGFFPHGNKQPESQ